MPRQARIKSETGVYHIMLRGANQQKIFHDEEDNRKFLKVIAEYKVISGYKIFAYCLMKNHVHILLKVEGEELQQIMKRIAGKYVYWYNAKYSRIGHLFQDRFRSEPVEDDKYFLTVLRYIHQNPVRAKMVGKIEDYPYSSYREYINDSLIADTDFAMGLIDKEEFMDFHSYIPNEQCLDIKEPSRRITDEEAKKILNELTKANGIPDLSDHETKTRFVNALKTQGLSIRQISRLTGISKKRVERI